MHQVDRQSVEKASGLYAWVVAVFLAKVLTGKKKKAQHAYGHRLLGELEEKEML